MSVAAQNRPVYERYFEAEGHNQIHALQQQPYSITSSDPQITSGEDSIA